jgi:hypothetical protein
LVIDPRVLSHVFCYGHEEHCAERETDVEWNQNNKSATSLLKLEDVLLGPVVAQIS